MDAALVEEIRRTPLFARLKDDELDCIRRGEIIELSPGATLVQENAPAEFFFLNLEGEISAGFPKAGGWPPASSTPVWMTIGWEHSPIR
jgi:hypothetical protein